MSSETESHPDETQPEQKRRSPLLLIVLLVILAVAIIGLLVDRQARASSQEAYDKIAQLLPRGEMPDAEDTGLHVSPEKVHQVVGSEPDDIADMGTDRIRETYSWRGAFRKYDVITTYRKGPAPFLIEVLQNREVP